MRVLAALGSGLVLAGAAHAHGFGQRFDLPLPLWLWMLGAAATLVLTFAALALFARRQAFTHWGEPSELLTTPARRRAAHAVAAVLRWIAVVLFVLTLSAGFFGTDDAYANLIVTMVWVLWWVGLAFFCALVGDLWEVVDPLRTLYLGAVRLLRLPRTSLGRPYPRGLGAWPGVALFFAFAWIELLWPDKDVPSRLAAAAAVYAALTWAGMAVFGVEAWRRHGDAFAMAFALLGRFAPLQPRSSSRGGGAASLQWRPYGAGLLTDAHVPTSYVVFVLLMLATVTFDGFHQTPLMERLETAAQTSRPVAEALFALSDFGIGEMQVLRTLVLLAFPIAFVIVFRAVAWAMLRLGSPHAHVRTSAANAMVLTLVPIAVAYHLSHYATLLLTTGQFIVPLASDPFGWGWNLLGTRGFRVNLAVVSPYVYWYGSVLLIVVGHVLSVVLAHVEARRRFATHEAALRSQLPMLALMVAYTGVSLWIMAQPIVG